MRCAAGSAAGMLRLPGAFAGNAWADAVVPAAASVAALPIDGMASASALAVAAAGVADLALPAGALPELPRDDVSVWLMLISC